MRIKYQISTIIVCLIFTVMPYLHALDGSQRNCLILLDQRNKCETIGHLHTWYLTSRLQSALAEQSTPILINAGLWNSFIERRIHFKQSLEQKDSPLYKIHKLYQTINEHIASLSHQYNTANQDVIQNKYLIVQSINDEFYNSENTVAEGDYQLLLDYFTPFDPEDWNIYKNGKGFYLFVPKKFSTQNPFTGFNIESLEEIAYPEHSPSIYFDSVVNGSIGSVLPDFFLTYNNFPDAKMNYAWNIILAGHGGSNYKEMNHEGTVTWNGQPIIADLTIQEFNDFFNDIATIDFSIGSIERLQEMMSSITYSIIANIPLLSLPGTNNFFPLYGADIVKIDERLLALVDKKDLILQGTKTILLESCAIKSALVLDHTDRFRMISIKPGDALHYIKKLQATSHIDLPSTFWQAQYQYYDKNFILDECSFPQSNDSLIFKDIAENELVLKNVIISQQKSHHIRLFFTVNDIAMMVVAYKPGQAEHIEIATIQEVVTLDAAAREKYEDYYLSLKNSVLP